MKPTNLVLDEDLLEEALRIAGTKTYSGAPRGHEPRNPSLILIYFVWFVVYWDRNQAAVGLTLGSFDLGAW
jgi:hypothetical protein